VIRFVPLYQSRGSVFRVALRDSSRTEEVHATIALGGELDSANVLSVKYVWMGTVRSVSPAEGQQLIRLAEQLLDELRVGCAPETPRRVTCEEQGWGRPKHCPTA
jgi:hypothetical protein